MGHAHSTNANGGGAADAGGKEGRELLQLLKRHVVTGDTPFHRAVRGSSSGPAARRRLEGLCDAVLQHHDRLARHLSAPNGAAAASPSGGFSRASWLGCTFGSGDDEDSANSEPWPTDGLEGLRRLLDLQNQRGQTALHLAAELGYAEAVELLLEQGANPWMTDRMGAHMPIHVACVHARLPCVKLLLDDLPAKWRRSPLDQSVSYVEAPTVSGFTPLHCAVASSDVACIRAVLAHHPRLDQGNRWDSWEYRLEFPRGTTPMHVAASKGSQDAAKELLRYFNSMLLASQGRLMPVPSPSVFGGHLPLSGAHAPADPRQAANSQQQLPWQVAYSMHLRSLAEMLHPSMPLTHFFPAPPVMTLQSLASAVLRQKLMHTLEAAQQADARQRQQQVVRLRLQLEQEEEEQQRQALRQHQQLGSSLQAVRSMPIALPGGRQGSGHSAASGPLSLGGSGTRAAAKVLLLGGSVGESVTSGMQRIKQALTSSSRTSTERLQQQQQRPGEHATSASAAAVAYSGSEPLSTATTSAVLAEQQQQEEEEERDALDLSAVDVALTHRAAAAAGPRHLDAGVLSSKNSAATVCMALVPEAVAAAQAAQAHRLATASLVHAKPGCQAGPTTTTTTTIGGRDLSRRSGAVSIASPRGKVAAAEYLRLQHQEQPPSSCPADYSPITKQQQHLDKQQEQQQQRPPLLVNSVSCRGMVVDVDVEERGERSGLDEEEEEGEERQGAGASAVLLAHPGCTEAAEDKEEEDDEDAGVCAVCLDAEARMEVVPCRHCLCAACSHELVRNMSLKPLSCPMCRAPVKGFGVAAAAAARFARHHRHD